MNLGAFAVITSLRRRDAIGDEIDDIAGLYQKAPTEAMLMLVFLLSLAGIPPLAGFWGKYFIFLSLIETQHYILAAGRCSIPWWPVLLPAHRQCHVRASRRGYRAGKHEPGDAGGPCHYRVCYGLDWRISGHVYPRRALGPGNRIRRNANWPAEIILS